MHCSLQPSTNTATQNLPGKGIGADFEMGPVLGGKNAISGSFILLPQVTHTRAGKVYACTYASQSYLQMLLEAQAIGGQCSYSEGSYLRPAQMQQGGPKKR